jgi:hypothetical protein
MPGERLDFLGQQNLTAAGALDAGLDQIDLLGSGARNRAEHAIIHGA